MPSVQHRQKAAAGQHLCVSAPGCSQAKPDAVSLAASAGCAGEATGAAGEQAGGAWDATKQKATEAGHRMGECGGGTKYCVRA